MTSLLQTAAGAILLTLKPVTALREGHSLGRLRAEAIAGLAVAVVALPLSMAIAIPSGASPDRGLVTSTVGGFFISALDSSRCQIGGLAGAFIVLVSATIQRHGYDVFLLATITAIKPRWYAIRRASQRLRARGGPPDRHGGASRFAARRLRRFRPAQTLTNSTAAAKAMAE
jgi:hypothetical protein